MPDQLDIFDSTPRAPGPARPSKLLLGCCAWQHDSFNEHFYPKGLAAKDQLRFYAQHFNSVEIDGTFYRVPAPSTVERWAAVTPPHFRFAMKAPKGVTHEGYLDLSEPPVRAEWEAMLSVLPRFDGKLAALLLQLGPSVAITLKDRLGRLLDTIPGDVPVAVEFRHPSWNRAEVNALLLARGVVRAWTDHYLDPARGVRKDDPLLFEATGAFRYVRLLGNVSTKYDRETGERVLRYGPHLDFGREEDLAEWRGRILREIDVATHVCVFVNNHYQGFAPVTVRQLAGE